MGTAKPRLTIRLTPNQRLVVEELAKALDTNESTLIRTIVGAWLAENEDYLQDLIDRKNYNMTHKEEDIFDDYE